MKTALSRCTAALGLVAGLSLAFSANAASTWVFAGAGTTDANGEPMAKTSYSSNGVAGLNISGAFATNGSGNLSYSSSTTKWQTNVTAAPDANPLYWSGNGLGMCSDGGTGTPSCGEPNHALDNNGNTEAILLSFSSSVMLTSIGIGYKSGDADISLWRYVGGTGKPASPAELSGVGATKSAMEAAGWALVGNYANLVEDEANPYNLVNNAKTDGSGDASASSVGSSWWLVTAYNTSYGTGTGLSQGDDYFKLYAVAGNACVGDTTRCGPGRVSEPGSLALAGLALFGVASTRRRHWPFVRKS